MTRLAITVRTKNSRLRNARRLRARRAGVVLELLLTMPILLIAFLATLQFGMLFSNLQQLALASRVGGLEAAQTAGLPVSPGAVPANIVQAVSRQLATAEVSMFGIMVEHNVDTPTPVLPIVLQSGSPACTQPLTPLPTQGQYVRVTVCVELPHIMPDLLGLFGFNITGRVAQQTTVYRYEL